MKKIIFQLCILCFTFQLAKAQEIVDTIPPASTNFISMGDMVFFTSNDSLYRSDGTESGTIFLENGIRGAHDFFVNEGLLYFITSPDYELWRSDGTPSGTFRLAASYLAVPHLSILGTLGNKVIFSMSHATYDIEPFVTDGTVGGTSLLRDIYPGYNPSLPASKGVLDSQLFFSALTFNPDIADIERELWKTDGTGSGTVQVKDINPTGTAFSIVSSPESGFAVNSNYIFFTADDGVHGPELWRSDGTEEGTVMVKDIVPGTSGSYIVSGGGAYDETFTPRVLTEAGDLIFFIAGVRYDASGEYVRLWKSDGTEAGTSFIKELPLSSIHTMFEFNEQLIIIGNIGIAYQVWTSDGTAAGTVMLKDHLRDGDNYLGHFTIVGDQLVFTDNIQGYEYQLWKTDGTPAGTELIREMNSAPGDIEVVDGLLFFTEHGTETYFEAGDGINDYELWQSDLTPGGTFMVKEIAGFSLAGSHNLTNVQDTLYFTTSDPVSRPMNYQFTDTKILWKYSVPALMVQSLTLVSSNTDNDIRVLAEVDTIYMDQDVNIRADVSGNVESVRFYINDAFRRNENQAPYALAGDNSGNYHEWHKMPGLYEITAIPYTGNGGSGEAGSPITRYVRVLYPTDTAGSFPFMLINAATDTEIRTLNDDDTIEVSSSTPITITAIPAYAQSVVFYLNGSRYRTENAAPFSLSGDSEGDFNAWNPAPGSYTLEARAYSGYSGTGILLQSETIDFTVIDASRSTLKLAAHPNPATDFTSVDISSEQDQQARLILTDYMGRVYLDQEVQVTAGANLIPLEISRYRLASGIYFVKIIGETEEKVVQLIKE